MRSEGEWKHPLLWTQSCLEAVELMTGVLMTVLLAGGAAFLGDCSVGRAPAVSSKRPEMASSAARLCSFPF